MTILFLVNGIGFVLSGISEIFIRYTHKKQETPAKFSSDFQDGFRFIIGQKGIALLCLFLMAVYTLVMPLFSVVLPLFFRTALDYPDVQYGVLQTVFIMGMFIGSIFTGLLFGKAGRENKAIVLGLFLLTGATFSFAVMTLPEILNLLGRDSAQYFWMLASVLGLLSVAVMFIAVPSQTVIQKLTPANYMSRVFSIVGMITRGGLPIGALVYGLLLERTEVSSAALAASALLMLTAVAFWVLSVRRQGAFVSEQ